MGHHCCVTSKAKCQTSVGSFAAFVAAERAEVTIREDDVKMLHPLTVIEETRGDSVLHLYRHFAVERGEITEARTVRLRGSDDGVKALDYLIDRRRFIHLWTSLGRV